MSDTMKKLVEELQKDESKQNKFKACKSAAEQAQFAKEMGFEVTEEEFEKMSKNVSDEQLDQVAGGCGFNLAIGG